MAKGKDLPLNIYELVGVRGLVHDSVLSLIKKFETALTQYQSRNFVLAKKLFEELVTEYNDSASKTFLERTNRYITEAPSEDWMGDYRATEK